MPFAVGMYLPVQTSSAIMIGGCVRLIVDKMKGVTEKQRAGMVNSALLYTSGLIAGEGILGILLAVFAIIPFGAGTLGDAIDLSGSFDLGWIGSVIACALLTWSIFYYAKKGKNDNLDSGELKEEIAD